MDLNRKQDSNPEVHRKVENHPMKYKNPVFGRKKQEATNMT